MIETKAKVAIFDIDQTFWAADSLRAFMRHFKREKRFKRGFEIRVAWHATTYALGFLNVQALCELILSGVRGMSQTRLREISQEIYRDKLRPHIFHEVVGIFDGYRRNGALTVLAGGAPREIHEQLVKDHPFDVLCSTQGETENDIFTGHLLGAPCFGKYKIEKVTKAICDQGLTLKEAAFYTDSYTDRPLLEAVGFPFAVNPDFRLRRLARKRGWPILEYGV